jgi:hypothetical protein
MIKKYVIKKIAYANNIEELESMFPGGETIYIELQEDIREPSNIGFIKTNGYRKRNKMV